jgi:hypothetical protein
MNLVEQFNKSIYWLSLHHVLIKILSRLTSKSLFLAKCFYLCIISAFIYILQANCPIDAFYNSEIYFTIVARTHVKNQENISLCAQSTASKARRTQGIFRKIRPH